MYGRRIRRILDERKIKHYLVAQDLKISTGQVNRILNDEIDMRVEQLEYFADLLNIPAWAFFTDKKSPILDLLQAVQQFVREVTPLIEPEREDKPDGSRVVTLLRVAATPDNETYDDDAEPRKCEVPREFHRPRVAGFEVVGDSMSGDGIVSGDIVFTRPPHDEVDAEGEICVCRIDGYRHLKRVFYRRGRVELVSSAPKRRIWRFDPQAHEFQVLGIVTGRMGRVAR